MPSGMPAKAKSKWAWKGPASFNLAMNSCAKMLSDKGGLAMKNCCGPSTSTTCGLAALVRMVHGPAAVWEWSSRPLKVTAGLPPSREILIDGSSANCVVASRALKRKAAEAGEQRRFRMVLKSYRTIIFEGESTLLKAALHAFIAIRD